MSDLRHQSLEELLKRKAYSEKRIVALGSQLSGKKVRLEWVEKYIKQKQEPSEKESLEDQEEPIQLRYNWEIETSNHI